MLWRQRLAMLRWWDLLRWQLRWRRVVLRAVLNPQEPQELLQIQLLQAIRRHWHMCDRGCRPSLSSGKWWLLR